MLLFKIWFVCIVVFFLLFVKEFLIDVMFGVVGGNIIYLCNLEVVFMFIYIWLKNNMELNLNFGDIIFCIRML